MSFGIRRLIRGRRARRLGYSLGVAVLALLVIEATAQVVRLIAPSWFNINQAPAWTATPGSSRYFFDMGTGRATGAGGEIDTAWLGPKYPREDDATSFRIFFLGDSSSLGYGIEREQNYPNLVGAKLGRVDRREARVILAADTGWSSTQCRIVFDDAKDRVRPNAVVLAALWSDIITRPWTDRDIMRKFSSGGFRYESALRLALRHSALFSLAEKRIESLKGIPDDRDVVFSKILGPEAASQSGGTPRVSPAEHRENLAAICAECVRRGIEIYLVSLPYAPAADHWPASRLQAYRENYFWAAKKYGASLVDGPALFTQTGRPLTELFLDEVHLNSAGQEVLAAALAGAIRIRHPEAAEPAS